MHEHRPRRRWTTCHKTSTRRHFALDVTLPLLLLLSAPSSMGWSPSRPPPGPTGLRGRWGPRHALRPPPRRLLRLASSEDDLDGATTGRSIPAKKDETASYIVKGMARELLLRGGLDALLRELPQKVIDGAAHHRLGTDAAVGCVSRLFEFGAWMMDRRLPYKALSALSAPLVGVGGRLEVLGFANLWEQFLTESGSGDFCIAVDDLGDFHAGAFLEGLPGPPSFGERSCTSDAPLVVFFQMPQGGGKSTLARTLMDRLRAGGVSTEIVEQDHWFGDTVSTQSYLSHLLKRTDTQVVLVSRCNANPRHYRAYVNRSTRANANVIFMAPRGIKGRLGLAVCLAGAMERSVGEDIILMGGKEMPEDEAAMIISNVHSELIRHPQAIDFDLFIGGEDPPIDDGEGDVDSAQLVEHVKTNLGSVLASRRCIDDVVLDLETEITNVRLAARHPAFVLPRIESTRLIAHYPVVEGQLVLKTEALRHLSACAETFHCTEIFLGNSGRKVRAKDCSKQDMCGPSLHGSNSTIIVTHLVRRQRDGHAAFRVRAPFSVSSGLPHITAYVPPTANAVESLEYVHLDESDGVHVIPLGEIEITATCRWT